jgi:glycosyltransferase involved in cell wall biosynthesis
LPLTQYGKHYNYCDVCLAPLAENTFNEVKSELKIIEAGLTKKVLIAQEFGIYKDLIQNGENGILIPKSKNVRGWYEAIRKVINDKDYREKLSNNLYNFVKDKYTLEIVTENRVKWYEEIYLRKKQSIAHTETHGEVTMDTILS